MLEVFVEVVDVLGHAVFEAGADADKVDHDEVVDVFAETDAARVRADRDAEPFGQQHDGQAFVDAAEAAAIELAEANRPRLYKLLERIRFWHISPVAIAMGATALAIAAWPTTSSGDVGSSTHHKSNSAS